MTRQHLQLLPSLANGVQTANIINLTIQEVNKLLDGTSVVNVSGTFTPRGAYDNAIDYTPGDFVSYVDGSSYIQFVDAVAGTIPTNITYWMKVANMGPPGLAGDNGINGKTVRNGTIPPNAGTGVENDFYIDTVTNKLYGPKTSGTWGFGVNLIGPAGIDGISGAGFGEIEDLGDRFTGINIHDLGTRV